MPISIENPSEKKWLLNLNNMNIRHAVSHDFASHSISHHKRLSVSCAIDTAAYLAAQVWWITQWCQSFINRYEYWTCVAHAYPLSFTLSPSPRCYNGSLRQCTSWKSLNQTLNNLSRSMCKDCCRINGTSPLWMCQDFAEASIIGFIIQQAFHSIYFRVHFVAIQWYHWQSRAWIDVVCPISLGS